MKNKFDNKVMHLISVELSKLRIRFDNYPSMEEYVRVHVDCRDYIDYQEYWLHRADCKPYLLFNSETIKQIQNGIMEWAKVVVLIEGKPIDGINSITVEERLFVDKNGELEKRAQIKSDEDE